MTLKNTIRVGDASVETSVLGFGCADLFREPSQAARRRLLDAAFDAGIRHFDVAPMYGLGLIESEVGRFARDKRDRIVIATKFGIQPTAAARLVAPVQSTIHQLAARLPTRRAGTRSPDVDPRSGAVGRLLYRSGDYTPQAARASLERSLRNLQTDYVDVLFLHDPAAGDVRSDAIARHLESTRAAGAIRAWGIAGEPARAVDAATRFSADVPVWQVRGDVFTRLQWRLPLSAAGALILFGVVGRALRRILAYVRADERVRRRWSETIGVDCASPDAVGRLLLADALRANRGGVVLFSSTHVERVCRAAADALAGPRDSEIDALRELVCAEIAAVRAQP